MSISFQPTRLVGAIAIAMGFSSTTVFADDSTDATKLDPIVVTASKSEEKVSQVPARITVISKKEIEKILSQIYQMFYNRMHPFISNKMVVLDKLQTYH